MGGGTLGLTKYSISGILKLEGHMSDDAFVEIIEKAMRQKPGE